jgi:L-alanine-DL-glutamate epimerase-like enolase superfamily enzyme
LKCGGIGEGMKMIRRAREFNLKVLVGSMSESGCGVYVSSHDEKKTEENK